MTPLDADLHFFTRLLDIIEFLDQLPVSSSFRARPLECRSTSSTTCVIRMLLRSSFISFPSSTQAVSSLTLSVSSLMQNVRTELYFQTSRLFTGSWQHLGLDLHASLARIWRYQRKEQSCRLGARAEGIERKADVGQEAGDHCGDGGRADNRDDCQ